MFIIIAHSHTCAGPGMQVAKRANGTLALYESRTLAQEQADRWNRILGKTGLVQHYFYHAYNIST